MSIVKSNISNLFKDMTEISLNNAKYINICKLNKDNVGVVNTINTMLVPALVIINNMPPSIKKHLEIFAKLLAKEIIDSPATSASKRMIGGAKMTRVVNNVLSVVSGALAFATAPIAISKYYAIESSDIGCARRAPDDGMDGNMCIRKDTVMEHILKNAGEFWQLLVFLPCLAGTAVGLSNRFNIDSIVQMLTLGHQTSNLIELLGNASKLNKMEMLFSSLFTIMPSATRLISSGKQYANLQNTIQDYEEIMTEQEQEINSLTAELRASKELNIQLLEALTKVLKSNDVDRAQFIKEVEGLASAIMGEPAA